MDARLDDPQFNYDDSVLAKDLERGWTMHRPDRATADNIAIFSSGWGDGIYDTYVGLDDADRVT